MTPYENDLTCWHFIKIVLLLDYRNASYQSWRDTGSTGRVVEPVSISHVQYPAAPDVK